MAHESILHRVFEHTASDDDLFERFTRYDKTHPERAECGNVHFAPNSVRGYVWGNAKPVPSRCDAWENFPDLSGQPRYVNCCDWGSGEIGEHHRW